MTRLSGLIAGIVLCIMFAITPELLAQTQRVYFGTYTRGASKGIYVCELNMKTGRLTEPRLAGETKNPSFLAISGDGKHLYSVGEMSSFNGKKTGAVTAFAIKKDGTLTQLNQQPSGGRGPCHIYLEGRTVLVANYGEGSVSSIPVKADGALGEPGSVVQHEGSSVHPRRQQGPHAHSINADPAGRYAVSADLGLDKVLIYRLDSDKGTIAANDPAFVKTEPGGGPRHFAFHPSGRFAYTNLEMTSKVTAMTWDADNGVLTPIQTLSTLPADHSGGNSTAETQVHPSGRFVYVSNRGHDSVAGFKVDQSTGKLTAIGHTPTGGKTPRNFGIDPTGTFLIAANQNTSDVFVFRIDSETGKLTPTGQSVKVGNPVCVKFLPLD